MVQWQNTAFSPRHLILAFGPVVKWYNGAFALRKRGFDSPQVHI